MSEQFLDCSKRERDIRIKPELHGGKTAFRKNPALKDDNCMYPFYKALGCDDALGMESGEISDGQITASSQWDSNHAASQGRLQFTVTGSKQGAWCSRSNDVNQWLQVYVGGQHNVTGVATQGRNGGLFDQWVTKYQLQYSNDGVNFQYYREQGETKTKTVK